MEKPMNDVLCQGCDYRDILNQELRNRIKELEAELAKSAHCLLGSECRRNTGLYEENAELKRQLKVRGENMEMLYQHWQDDPCTGEDSVLDDLFNDDGSVKEAEDETE